MAECKIARWLNSHPGANSLSVYSFGRKVVLLVILIVISIGVRSILINIYLGLLVPNYIAYLCLCLTLRSKAFQKRIMLASEATGENSSVNCWLF